MGWINSGKDWLGQQVRDQLPSGMLASLLADGIIAGSDVDGYGLDPSFDLYGSAGLVSAYIGAAVKAKVALIERHLMGGDCLNVGCVPSKSIIGAARIAAQARDGARFGIRTGAVDVAFAAGSDESSVACMNAGGKRRK
jgi:hypothetical protein